MNAFYMLCNKYPRVMKLFSLVDLGEEPYHIFRPLWEALVRLGVVLYVEFYFDTFEIYLLTNFSFKQNRSNWTISQYVDFFNWNLV